MRGAAALLALTVLGCDLVRAGAPAAPGEPVTLVISDPNTGNHYLAVGVHLETEATFALSSRVLDAAGRVVSDVRPTWVTRAPAVVTVDSLGVLHFHAPGTSVVVASLPTGAGNTLSDSINVSVACTAILIPYLQVTVVDSVAPAPSGFSDLTVVTRDGAFTDSAFYPSWPAGQTAQVTFARERPGTYRVTVGARGYRTWVRDSVVVRGAICHVIPVSLTARLVRE